MKQLVEMGKISSRGQIAIPISIRKELDLHEGQKIMFFLEENTLFIKKIVPKTFAELTKPLRATKKKISEGGVVESIHNLRKRKSSH